MDTSHITRDHVRKLRDDLGMTQSEFGELVGAKQWTVSRWESGDTIDVPFRRLIVLVVEPLAAASAKARAPYREP